MLSFFNDVCNCNMVRGSNFRLLYRVIFFCFCLSFACFYHHGSGDDKQGDKFKGEHLNEDVFLKQDERVPNLTGNAKRDNAWSRWRKARLSRMSKKGKFGRHENANFNHNFILETVMKTRQSDRVQKISKLSSLTPSPPEVKVPGKESITTLHLSHTNSRNNGAPNIASSKNSILHQKRPTTKKSLVSLTTRNLRGKQDVSFQS